MRHEVGTVVYDPQEKCIGVVSRIYTSDYSTHERYLVTFCNGDNIDCGPEVIKRYKQLYKNICDRAGIT